jgi:hypothetical protein
MAFQIRCNFDRIQSYAQAVEAWEKGVIFHELGSPLMPRGLVDKRKKHMTVERSEATRDIILRLYGFSVITWHEDNSFTLCPYKSRSTVVFANHCTPLGMHVQMCGSNFALTVDGRTYKVSDTITFRKRDDTWKPDQIRSWSVRVVNRERAKQARLETGYNEFRDWFKVYVQMAPAPFVYEYMDNAMVVSLLRERKWRELVNKRPNAWHSLDKVLQEIRQAIYQECECIERKSVPFLG